MFRIIFTGFLFILPVLGFEEIFDEKYHTFPKDDSLASFGYDVNHACMIRTMNNELYVGLSDAYTVFKTPHTRLLTIDNESQIEACFNYKGFSYIINREDNITGIMRGRLTRNFKLPRYDKLIFDHLLSKLYSVECNKLKEINLTMVENFWIINNYPQVLLKERKSVSLNNLFTFRSFISRDIKDLIIFNNTIYFIRPEPNGKLRIYKKIIGEIQEEYVSETEEPTFDFIPFIQISNYYENNPKLKLSFGSVSPSIVISLPSSSIKSKEELSTPVIILLYFLDAIFVIITVYGIRHLFKFSKQKYENYKIKYDETDLSNDEHVSLASLPYRDIIVSSK